MFQMFHLISTSKLPHTRVSLHVPLHDVQTNLKLVFSKLGVIRKCQNNNYISTS